MEDTLTIDYTMHTRTLTASSRGLRSRRDNDC